MAKKVKKHPDEQDIFDWFEEDIRKIRRGTILLEDAEWVASMVGYRLETPIEYRRSRLIILI